MDMLLLTLGILIVVSMYYNKKLGAIVGLIAMIIIIEYPTKIKVKDSSNIEISCEKKCSEDDKNKLVCKTECIKNLRGILK